MAYSMLKLEVSGKGGIIESRFYNIVVIVLLFYVHAKHLRSCRDGPLT